MSTETTSPGFIALFRNDHNVQKKKAARVREMPRHLAVRTAIQVEDVACFPRAATLYGITELARRAGVSAEMLRTWRIDFGEHGVVNVYVRPGSNQRIRFPQADLWFWNEIHRGQFCTSTAEWMCNPGATLALVPDFKIPFSSARREHVGPLFAQEGVDCVECALDLPISALLTLSRFEETFPGPRDVHGRFSAFLSLAWREGFLRRPIVDEYGLALEQALSYLLPAWRPEERRLRVKIGHDVDEIGVPFSVRTALGHTLRRKLPLATLRDLAAPLTGVATTYEKLLQRMVELSLERNLSSAVYWKAQVPGTRGAGYNIRCRRIRNLIAAFRAQDV